MPWGVYGRRAKPARSGQGGAHAKGDPMARGQRGKSGEGSNGSAGHNSNRAERLAAQDKAISDWCKLQDQEDALLDKHIGPIRKKKNKIKADLKSMYGIPTEAFNARAGMRRVELTGEDEVVLATRELFEATPIGHNLDFVEIAERVAKKAAEKAAKAAQGKNTEADA